MSVVELGILEVHISGLFASSLAAWLIQPLEYGCVSAFSKLAMRSNPFCPSGGGCCGCGGVAVCLLCSQSSWLSSMLRTGMPQHVAAAGPLLDQQRPLAVITPNLMVKGIGVEGWLGSSNLPGAASGTSEEDETWPAHGSCWLIGLALCSRSLCIWLC